MFSRWISVPLVLVLAAPVAAGDKKVEAFIPAVVVRVKSLDAVIDNFKLLAKVVGQEEIAQQLKRLIETKVDPKGLEGIDPARPFGFYGRMGQEFNDVTGVVMVPIKDEAKILGLLDNLNLTPKKGKDGLYTVSYGEKVQVFFRFANKYAYFTAITPKSVEANKLLAPDRVFGAQQAAALSATVRLDQVPKLAQAFVTAALEDQIEKADKKLPNETDAQHALRLESLKGILTVTKTVLEEGQELAADLDVDAKTKELTARFRLSGKPKSALADALAHLAQRKSVFGGLKTDNAVVAGRLHVVAPEAITKVIHAALAEESKKAINSITDEKKRKQAENLVKILAANFKAGEIDAAIQLTGPGKNKTFTLLAGIKLQDGAALGQLVHLLLKDVPGVTRDAESAGAIKIHKIDVHLGFDAQAEEAFGKHPLYLAFRPDAVMVALGEEGLTTLKTALANAPAPGWPVHLEIDLARLAPLLAKTDEQKAAVNKLFGAGDDGRLRLTVHGGAALEAQFTARLSVLQFFRALAAKDGAKK